MYQNSPNVASMSNDPNMMRAPSSGNDVPVHCRKGAVSSMSCARMVSLPEYQRLSAKKMLQLPSVTMNGGNLSRVTSSPLIDPQTTPTTNPAMKAIGSGSPNWIANLPITTEERTMIAPTERSMPAVRTTRD